MLNITAVFQAVLNVFTQACDWLFTHGLTIGSFQITFGSMAIAFIVLELVLSFIPDYDGEED